MSQQQPQAGESPQGNLPCSSPVEAVWRAKVTCTPRFDLDFKLIAGTGAKFRLTCGGIANESRDCDVTKRVLWIVRKHVPRWCANELTGVVEEAIKKAMDEVANKFKAQVLSADEAEARLRSFFNKVLAWRLSDFLYPPLKRKVSAAAYFRLHIQWWVILNKRPCPGLALLVVPDYDDEVLKVADELKVSAPANGWATVDDILRTIQNELTELSQSFQNKSSEKAQKAKALVEVVRFLRGHLKRKAGQTDDIDKKRWDYADSGDLGELLRAIVNEARVVFMVELREAIRSRLRREELTIGDFIEEYAAKVSSWPTTTKELVKSWYPEDLLLLSASEQPLKPGIQAAKLPCEVVNLAPRGVDLYVGAVASGKGREELETALEQDNVEWARFLSVCCDDNGSELRKEAGNPAIRQLLNNLGEHDRRVSLKELSEKLRTGVSQANLPWSKRRVEDVEKLLKEMFPGTDYCERTWFDLNLGQRQQVAEALGRRNAIRASQDALDRAIDKPFDDRRMVPDRTQEPFAEKDEEYDDEK